MWMAGASSTHAKTISGDTMTGYILLRLEEDDMQFGSKEATEDHCATEANWDAHSGGLNLGGGREKEEHQWSTWKVKTENEIHGNVGLGMPTLTEAILGHFFSPYHEKHNRARRLLELPRLLSIALETDADFSRLQAISERLETLQT